MDTPEIIWPEKFIPAKSPVFIHNEIEIIASADIIWFWLTNAVTWHEWYSNAAKVKFVNQQDSHLKAGTEFTWKTFGFNLTSQVQEFVVNERLAWSAVATGINAYHAWLITPKPGGVCRVITEETQHGLFCKLGDIFMPKRMYKYHQLWLDGLKAKAENHNM